MLGEPCLGRGELAPDAHDAVAACVAESAAGWMFPRKLLADHTFERTFALPVDAEQARDR